MKFSRYTSWARYGSIPTPEFPRSSSRPSGKGLPPLPRPGTTSSSSEAAPASSSKALVRSSLVPSDQIFPIYTHPPRPGLYHWPQFQSSMLEILNILPPVLPLQVPFVLHCVMVPNCRKAPPSRTMLSNP